MTQNVGQMVCQTHISLVADRYGRKMSFIYAWVILMLVSDAVNDIDMHDELMRLSTGMHHDEHCQDAPSVGVSPSHSFQRIGTSIS